MRALAFIALALVALPAEADVHVIVAGNNRGRASDRPLRYAEHDARQIAAVMRALGRASPENISVLLGERAETLRRVLLKTNARIRGSGSNDQLIVYYSGHADADGLHLGDSSISFDEVRTFVESSPARVRVLILDACRSGGLTRLKGASPAESFVIRLEDRVEAEGLAIITSSADDEDSQESQQLQASFFTHHLVTALRGAADTNRDRQVTLAEAFAHAHQETRRSTGRTLVIQHPTYRFELQGSNDVVLTYLGAPSGPSGTVEIQPGSYLFFAGSEDGPIIAELTTGPANGVLVLEPARYFVRRRDPDRYREATFDLPENGRVDLSQLEYRDVRYAELVRKGAIEASMRLSLFGALDSPLGDGAGVAPGARLTWGVDWPALTVEVTGRWSARSGRSIDADLTMTLHEIAPGVRLQRFFDVGGFALAIGGSAELVFYRQVFRFRGQAPTRSGAGAALGALAAIERPLVGPLSLRLELGPVVHVLKRATTRGGLIAGERLEGELTFAGGAGVTWRY